MDERFSRTEILLGSEGMKKLTCARVAVFGLGGVGSFAAEALARAGIGSFILVDADTVDATNINRQLIAFEETVGRPKVDVECERILSINPNAEIEKKQVFFLGQDIISGKCDYIVDAVDTVSAKIALALLGEEKGIPVISSMGTAGKLSPQLFKVADIYKTSGCPLAKVMRKELRARGVKRLKCVYSPEEARAGYAEFSSNGKKVLGSVSFVPSVAGLIMAGEVIKDISEVKYV